MLDPSKLQDVIETATALAGEWDVDLTVQVKTDAGKITVRSRRGGSPDISDVDVWAAHILTCFRASPGGHRRSGRARQRSSLEEPAQSVRESGGDRLVVGSLRVINGIIRVRDGPYKPPQVQALPVAEAVDEPMNLVSDMLRIVPNDPLRRTRARQTPLRHGHHVLTHIYARDVMWATVEDFGRRLSASLEELWIFLE
ncbi:MAG: hypothetical protein MMC23_010188 [Stictis urceolatum]|nr:hypothetical protein [Stictis urceolata]